MNKIMYQRTCSLFRKCLGPTCPEEHKNMSRHKKQKAISGVQPKQSKFKRCKHGRDWDHTPEASQVMSAEVKKQVHEVKRN